MRHKIHLTTFRCPTAAHPQGVRFAVAEPLVELCSMYGVDSRSFAARLSAGSSTSVDSIQLERWIPSTSVACLTRTSPPCGF